MKHREISRVCSTVAATCLSVLESLNYAAKFEYNPPHLPAAASMKELGDGGTKPEAGGGRLQNKSVDIPVTKISVQLWRNTDNINKSQP